MGSLLQDVRYALRMLRKSPGFTAVAVITLALGIGANTAIFSVVNAVLLRPLPFSESNRIVRLQEDHGGPTNVTGATFRDVRERNHVFSQIAAYRIFSLNLSDRRRAAPPEQIDTAFVSQDFLPLLAIQPFLGRGFAEAEFRNAGPHAVLLSHGLWQHHFGSDPAILTKEIELHGNSYVVAGVMPADFSFPEDVQAWTPLTDERAIPQNRRAQLFRTIARLKPGVSIDQARAELQTIAAAIHRENSDIDPGFKFRVQGLQQNMVSGVRPSLLILLSAVGFVLLIACANVANLLLSRAAARQKETAIRAALGAARLRLARQFLTESILLGLIGGGLGCWLGFWAIRVLAASYPGVVPGLAMPGLDPRILGFALAVSFGSAILFGVVPALHLSNLDLHHQLVEGGRSTQPVSRRRVRSALMASEVALALVLLAGAGLLIRSFVLVQRVERGYDSSNLLIASVVPPDARYPDLQQTMQFVNTVLERFRGLPGVRSAAATGALPFRPTATTDLELEGRVYQPGNEPSAQIMTASPEYFRTMGIRLLAGRAFTPQDVLGRPTALVVNQTMAQRYWPGESPIGKRVVMKDWGPPLPGEIVGVVGDVKQDSLEGDVLPAIYYSLAQFPEGTLAVYFVVRVEANPLSLAPAVRNQIWSVDRDQPVDVALMDQIISDSLQRRRFMLMLLGTFAGLALLLSMIGVYGVIAYSVGQRTHEFGIRMAIGARQRDLLLMVLKQSLRTVAVGLAIGLVAALGLTPLMGSLLYGIGATDPLTFSVIAVLLVTVAVVASYIPARRAANIDPMVALRYE